VISEPTPAFGYSARGLDINNGLSEIPSQFAIFTHPFLVPILMSEMMVEHLTCKLVDLNREFELIKEETVFSDFISDSNRDVWDY